MHQHTLLRTKYFEPHIFVNIYVFEFYLFPNELECLFGMDRKNIYILTSTLCDSDGHQSLSTHGPELPGACRKAGAFTLKVMRKERRADQNSLSISSFWWLCGIGQEGVGLSGEVGRPELSGGNEGVGNTSGG
jgi:hypothetical protein